MVQVMLDNVRAGRDTCAVFYGHPGIFVYPTHKAISILRQEGYRAAMLPAISALDCLWADLGVDPSSVGSQTFEATDLLLRQRPMATDSHVVVWQIGCVGDAGFNFAGYDNRNLDILVSYLEQFYGPDHEVVHYQGSQFPICSSHCDRMPLAELRHAAVTGISTLYIPPLTQRTTNIDMALRLGLITDEKTAAIIRDRETANLANAPAAPAAPVVGAPSAASASSGRLRTSPESASNQDEPPVSSAAKPAMDDTALEASQLRRAHNRRFLDEVKKRREGPQARYKKTIKDNALANYIADMMLNPRLLADFMRNPEQSIANYGNLLPYQEEALLSLHSGRIRMAMKDNTIEESLSGAD